MARSRFVTMALLPLVLTLGCGAHAAVAQEGSAPPTAEASPSPGFATPEEAVREYLAGVAHADIERILRTSAADEMSQGYRFDLMVERIGSFFQSMNGPVRDPFLAEIERRGWLARLLAQVRMLAYSLLAPDSLGDALEYQPLEGVDAAWAQDLTAALDSSRLSDLAVVDIALPSPELYLTATNLANMARFASIVSADEKTERVALFAFEGDLFASGFTLLRYGDGWKVESQTSVVGGIGATGAAQPITLDEWERLTSG